MQTKNFFQNKNARFNHQPADKNQKAFGPGGFTIDGAAPNRRSNLKKSVASKQAVYFYRQRKFLHFDSANKKTKQIGQRSAPPVFILPETPPAGNFWFDLRRLVIRSYLKNTSGLNSIILAACLKKFFRLALAKRQNLFEANPLRILKLRLQIIFKIPSSQKVPVFAAVFALFLAFGFGAWFALNTTHLKADDQPQGQVLSEVSPPPRNPIPLTGVAVSDQGSVAANNAALLNTPLEYLQSYFDASNKPDIIEQRTLQISQFLKDMRSPLVPAAETIAKQDHWKLILAIGFAESTLGKNCTDNNCSNIGVGPSSDHWRKYATYSEWVKDFNSLLERKYKDWTLRDMCGVYVQPCNQNWLIATQQILDKLKDRGIE